ALTTRRNELLEEIRSDVERVRAESYASVAGATPDIGDEAVADLLADVGEAEVTRDFAELRALEAALKRVAARRATREPTGRSRSPGRSFPRTSGGRRAGAPRPRRGRRGDSWRPRCFRPPA